MSRQLAPGTIFFFGCHNREVGHYFHGPGLQSAHSAWHPTRWSDVVPWSTKLDGGLLDETKPQVEGAVTYAQHQLRRAGTTDFWSAVSWWDRSVDKRPGSNCSFLVNEAVGPTELVTRALVVYPEVFARFKYAVTFLGLRDDGAILLAGAKAIQFAVVHQGGATPGLARCGAPMDSHPGSVVNCPECWRALGWCAKCGCPPAKGPCAHTPCKGCIDIKTSFHTCGR